MGKISEHWMAGNSIDVLCSDRNRKWCEFTDGLDGLASSVTVLVATFFTVVAIGTKSGIEPITCAVVGALLGFSAVLMYIRQVCLWGIRVPWRWEDL